MYTSTLASVAAFTFSVTAIPSTGYAAYYSPFNRMDRGIQSLGPTAVHEQVAGDSLNFSESTLSMEVQELREGCSCRSDCCSRRSL